MKQSVRREAAAGIEEYLTDDTAVRSAQREQAEDFSLIYHEMWEAELADRRSLILKGIDPDSGEYYSVDEYRDLIPHLLLTDEELAAAAMTLTMLSDFDFGVIEDELSRAWSYHR